MLKIVWLVLLLACSKGSEAEREAAAARLDTLATSTVRDRLQQDATKLQQRAKKLAAQPDIVELFAPDPERAKKARLALAKVALGVENSVNPADMALVDPDGNLIAMHDVLTVVAKKWRSEQPGKKTVFAALDVALASPTSVSDIVIIDDTPVRIATATVVDGDRLLGAVVLLNTIDGKRATGEANGLDTELGYAVGTKVFFTSLGTGGASEISKWLATSPSRTDVFVAGTTESSASYVARTVEIPRVSATKLPADYPATPVSLVLFGKLGGSE